MVSAVQTGQVRVWIVEYSNWQPRAWSDVPPQAVAVEPAEEAPMSPLDARSYIEGFNETALADQAGHWAVAVPVRTCYEGDFTAGETVSL